MCRDFANGFLMAEVLSRYFPNDVSMHSFENVNSTPKKRSNWHLVSRFLATRGLSVSQQQLDDVMAQEEGAIDDLITLIYECALYMALHSVIVF